ncbi:hypothetical protein BBH99_21750 [Chryseobacterium contaminans]|uniref:Uncharacterized protein n=1 Tax=Chryseobacterium contaminans TaxID=1423959 RepID=A0ABX2X5R6_9FLAO|nr:hypothetical protein BBH99_21750 [Chryseobacterium contaminans]
MDVRNVWLRMSGYPDSGYPDKEIFKVFSLLFSAITRRGYAEQHRGVDGANEYVITYGISGMFPLRMLRR